MAVPANEQDVYETSSFSSLILQEESEEIIPLDLHVACLIGDTESVQDFIQRKADLNKINRGGWTPLMYAAYVGRDNILKTLLGAKAEVDIKSKKQGQTALMLASYCASESIIYFLLQHGACINMQDHSGRTSLAHAVKQGHQSAVNLLATHGADVNLSEYNSGLSPLMEAAISGHENIFNILLTHGANLNQRSKSGESIRNLAARSGHTVIVNLIDAATQSLCSQISEETPLRRDNIDINQGPREFLQMCADRGMSNASPLPSPKNFMENNNYEKSNEHLPAANVPDMDKYNNNNNNNNNERFWQTPSGLPMKIHKLFEEFNVISYLPLFEKQGVDVAAFLTLTDDDMKNMGVEKLGPRKRIKLVIDKYRQIMKAQSTEAEPSKNENMERLNMQLQQAVAYIQKLQAHEQQYRSDFGKYVEAEQRRMSQIMFYMKDIGKNCKEAIGQLRKIKDHQRRMECLLNDIKTHPNTDNLSSDLRVDSSLYESANSVKCEIEMASNRLDMTCKQVERTLNVAQMNMPQESHPH